MKLPTSIFKGSFGQSVRWPDTLPLAESDRKFLWTRRIYSKRDTYLQIHSEHEQFRLICSLTNSRDGQLA